MSGSTPQISLRALQIKVCCVYRFRHVRILPPILSFAVCSYSAPSVEPAFYPLRTAAPIRH
ncbi:protein of unknown function [Shinella sp. WSC3-e]|nr:hypothetical protein SHINE37_41289 [Rhizobiaceae bacterium]CAK7255927.1 protein of unknown function [Shinella sp. WSC3-e]